VWRLAPNEMLSGLQRRRESGGNGGVARPPPLPLKIVDELVYVVAHDDSRSADAEDRS